MNKLRRAWRHLFTTTADGRRAFPLESLEKIQQAIAAGEQLHRAEIRLIVEPALSLDDALEGLSARDRARELFSQYAVWDTEENCGILVYINLADHKVEIVADRAVNRLLSAPDWQAVCATMTQGYAQGDYHGSTIAGMEQLNALLAAQFPAEGTRANQLPDRPLVL